MTDIPSSVGLLSVQFENTTTIRKMIVVVYMMEKDDTPEAAIRAGYNTFVTELHNSVKEEIVSLADLTRRDGIVKDIKNKVKSKVEDVISTKLSWWQKLEGDQDDPVKGDYVFFHLS